MISGDHYACGQRWPFFSLMKSICIDGRHLGPKIVAVIEKWPPKLGFKMNGHLERVAAYHAGVVVKRGFHCTASLTFLFRLG